MGTCSSPIAALLALVGCGGGGSLVGNEDLRHNRVRRARDDGRGRGAGRGGGWPDLTSSPSAARARTSVPSASTVTATGSASGTPASRTAMTGTPASPTSATAAARTMCAAWDARAGTGPRPCRAMSHGQQPRPRGHLPPRPAGPRDASGRGASSGARSSRGPNRYIGPVSECPGRASREPRPSPGDLS